MNANYAALLASGKMKMDQGHYVEAKADFTKAKEIKVTEDVVRLSLACEEKIEPVLTSLHIPKTRPDSW